MIHANIVRSPSVPLHISSFCHLLNLVNPPEGRYLTYSGLNSLCYLFVHLPHIDIFLHYTTFFPPHYQPVLNLLSSVDFLIMHKLLMNEKPTDSVFVFCGTQLDGSSLPVIISAVSRYPLPPAAVQDLDWTLCFLLSLFANQLVLWDLVNSLAQIHAGLHQMCPPRRFSLSLLKELVRRDLPRTKPCNLTLWFHGLPLKWRLISSFRIFSNGLLTTVIQL